MIKIRKYATYKYGILIFPLFLFLFLIHLSLLSFRNIKTVKNFTSCQYICTQYFIPKVFHLCRDF